MAGPAFPSRPRVPACPHLREWSAGAGVEFIDLFPTFFAQGAPRKAIERLYLRDDVHFSEAGHKLVADTLAALWRERIAAD
ncbi:MAG: hypothetical protein VW338_14920 [Rhodospirillaceae bacterium]